MRHGAGTHASAVTAIYNVREPIPQCRGTNETRVNRTSLAMVTLPIELARDARLDPDTKRVVRGGSFRDMPIDARVSARRREFARLPFDDVGIRPVVDLEE